MQDLYTENYKTSLKESKEDVNKWKNIPCSWIRRLDIVKMAIPLKMIYIFNTIPIRIPAGFFLFSETNRLILKFMWKFKGSRITKTILKKKSTHTHTHTHTQTKRRRRTHLETNIS